MRNYDLRNAMKRGEMFEYLNDRNNINLFIRYDYYELFQVLEEYHNLIVDEIGEEKAKKIEQKLGRIYAKKQWEE